MSANRSDKYYFPHGDLVIQVENTLFRLHRDILERHSGFFEDMFSIPTNDDTEGTEANPLVLPSDLCSARSFTILCKLLYPQKLVSHPKVSVNKVELWEPVLHAAMALQINGASEFLLAQLEKDTPNIKSNAAKLLRLSMDYREESPSFLVTCLRILAYRRKPIIPDEASILGERGTCLVNQARERIRDLQILTLTSLSHRAEDFTRRGAHAECRRALLYKVLENLQDKESEQTDDAYDIFHGVAGQVPCTCLPEQDNFLQTLKNIMNDAVDPCIEEVLSTTITPGE